MILAIDGAWRQGYSPGEIEAALIEKQRVNREERTWPDWRECSGEQAIEHIKKRKDK